MITWTNYSFVAGDVGSLLFIKSGTNWIPGWYPIASVLAGVATLNAAIGARAALRRGHAPEHNGRLRDHSQPDRGEGLDRLHPAG